MKKLKLIFFSAVLTAAFLFLADYLLGVLNFSSDHPPHAHPPNYLEQRENLEFSYTFITNSEGIRYPNIPLEKPENEYRVLALGDSFVEGHGVENGKRFTDLLEKSFSSSQKKVRFINMGLSGTGPQEYEQILNSTGWGYNPDAVLLCLYANDVSNIKLAETSVHKKQRPSFFQRFYPQIDALMKKALRNHKKSAEQQKSFETRVVEQALRQGISSERIAAWRQNIPQKWFDAAHQNRITPSLLSLGLLQPDYWTDSLDIASPKAREKWAVMESVLNRIITVSREKQLKVFLVFIPCPFQYDARAYDQSNPPLPVLSGITYRNEWLTETTQLEENLRHLSLEENVPFLNLTPLIRSGIAEEPDLLYPLDGHWNHHGHAWAAQAIQNWLEDNALLA